MMPNSQRVLSHKLTPQLHLNRTLPYLYQDVSFQVIFYTLGPAYFVVFHPFFIYFAECFISWSQAMLCERRSQWTKHSEVLIYQWRLKVFFFLILDVYDWNVSWPSSKQPTQNVGSPIFIGISHYIIENLCFSIKGIRNSIEPCYSAQFTCRI